MIWRKIGEEHDNSAQLRTKVRQPTVHSADSGRLPVNDGLEKKHRISAWLFQVRTPTLKRLWQEGVKFTRYYAAAAGAAPAHAAMMTGLYAYQTFFMHGHEESGKNAIARNAPRPPELLSDFPTYGKLLHAAGYDTPLLGTWGVFGAAKVNGADEAEHAVVRMESFGFSRLEAFAGKRRTMDFSTPCGHQRETVLPQRQRGH